MINKYLPKSRFDYFLRINIIPLSYFQTSDNDHDEQELDEEDYYNIKGI